jgi:hypothetical protein
MKKLFEVNDSERQRILEMHIDATKNFYITEQVKSLTVGPISRVSKVNRVNQDEGQFQKEYDEITKKYPNKKDVYSYRISKLDAEIKEYLSQESVVRKLLNGDNQISIWNDILVNGKYFAADLIKKVITKQGRKYKSARVGRKEDEKELTKPDNEEVTPPNKEVYQNDTITTPSETQQGYFQNNLWELSELGVDSFYDTFIAPYQMWLDEARKKSPGARMCVKSINIISSASRFRNTKGASDLTFIQLSKNRADSVLNFLLTQYGNLKGQVDDRNKPDRTLFCSGEVLNKKNAAITINPNGSNGDGTSGPNPPSPYLFTSTKFSGFKSGGNSEQYRNEYGTPISGSDQGGNVAYEKFKYVKPTVEIVLDLNLPNNSPVPGEQNPPAPDNVPSLNKKYWASLRYNTWKWNWNLDIDLGGGIPRQNTDSTLTTENTFQCPGVWNISKRNERKAYKSMGK